MLNNNLCNNILDNLYDGLYCVDKDKKITYWNSAAERLTGFKSSEIMGKLCSGDILVHMESVDNNNCRKICPVEKTLTEGHILEKELILHRKDGHHMPVFVRVVPIRDYRGDVIGATELFNDNSPKLAFIQQIEKLEQMAYIDSLTELPNRRYSATTLYSRYNELQRYSWPFGILMIDIDKFKYVNDLYGHDVGDKVLKMVAQTLDKNKRPFDFVGRWGGEEFLAISVNVDKDELSLIAHRYRILIEKSSILVNSHPVQVTVSLGATLMNQKDTIESLLKRVDDLMYQSKIDGRNRVTIES
jgi:diguanylate cyclase (GGDEF)-like protein/PAS domain S-box-containing protein